MALSSVYCNVDVSTGRVSDGRCKDIQYVCTDK